MFNLKNLISPIVGLSLVRKGIESELKQRVPIYEIVYKANEKTIFFNIPNGDKIRSYPYEDSAKLCNMIENLVKIELKTNDKIDIVKINHVNDTAIIDIYYRNEQGEKLHLKQTI